MEQSMQADLIRKGSNTGMDGRKIGKSIIGLGLLGLLGFGVAKYVLPFLVTVAWNMVSLGIAGVILFVLYILFTNKKFWKRLGYFVDFLAKLMLGWLIEFDEFLLQEKQIEQAEKDTENVLTKKEEVEGKYVELNQKVQENIKNAEISKESYNIALSSNPPDTEGADDAAAQLTRCQTYVETIGPITQDMKFIVDYSAEMYKVLVRKIKNAKMDLQASKDVFYSAQMGASALMSAKRAFFGDTALNSDADVAKQRVKEKIALSIGQMRSSMEILSSVTKADNLRDKAKWEIAKRQLTAIGGTEVVTIPTSNTFNGLEIPVNTKYKNLL